MASPSTLQLLPGRIRAQVEHLLARAAFDIQVDDIRKGLDTAPCADRFTVLIPCFLELMRWDVVYDAVRPWLPPDVIFGADDADFQPLSSPHSKACRILKGWNLSAEEEDNLLRLVTVLREQYLHHQRKRLLAINDERLRVELTNMKSFKGLEMGVLTSNNGQEVIFSVPILEEHDLGLPGLLEEPQLHLEARYRVSESVPSSALIPQLKLHASLTLKDALDAEGMTLPAWRPQDDMCLVEYVPKVVETLKLQAREAHASLALRQSFGEAMVAVYGHSLETDATFYRRMCFMASVGLFTFLIHVSLSVHFPKVQPTLTLQSSRHFDSANRALSRVCEEYPWSPRWDAQEMAQRICDFVAEEVVSFRNFCRSFCNETQYGY